MEENNRRLCRRGCVPSRRHSRFCGPARPCNRGATSSADHHSVAMSEGSCKAGFAITASDDSGVWPDFGAEP